MRPSQYQRLTEIQKRVESELKPLIKELREEVDNLDDELVEELIKNVVSGAIDYWDHPLQNESSVPGETLSDLQDCEHSIEDIDFRFNQIAQPISPHVATALELRD